MSNNGNNIATLLDAVSRTEQWAQGIAGWEFCNLEHAYAPRPPLAYVVSGLLPIESLSIFYGVPGTFKTMLLQDMAVCVAAGSPWLPPLPGHGGVTPRATRRAPVLWIDFDNGGRRTHERFGALARAQNVPVDTPLHYVSMPTPWLNAFDPEAVDALIPRISELGAKLVILDNLGAVSGGADENSIQMLRVLHNLRRMAEGTGAAVVLIHHPRKGTGGRLGENLRGHSSIEAAVDLALLVERTADIVKVRTAKSRDADVPPFSAMFTWEHRSGTRELETAQFFGVPDELREDELVVRQAILEIVRDCPEINKTALKEAAYARVSGVGINRIPPIIDDMHSERLLVMTTGPNGASLYTLN